MKKKEWSYRKSLTKVATVLVVFMALTSAGMTARVSASTQTICDVMPEICGTPDPGGIQHGSGDDSGWLYDTERREQILLDMPRTTSGTPEHPVVAVDRKRVQGDVPAWLNPATGRTLVPLRFIAEAFGAKVDWVGANGPDDPRVPRDWPGKYQIWIWSPWGYWGNYSLGERYEAGNWNLRR